MAFDPNLVLEKFGSKPLDKTTGFNSDLVLEKFKTKSADKATGFDSNLVLEKFGSKTSNARVNLDTSDGLYQLAVQSGLKNKADQILAKQAGEKPKEIFSGGFISDTFDVLNALQYGVVGLLKGKSFMEGVKTRQSFSDQDALGDKGIPGTIMGIALDIAFDPLTYIAPATVIRKIPFATKGLKAGKEAVFGSQVVKELPETIASKEQQLTRLVEETEGGTKLGKYLASKLSWRMGKDPVFMNTLERSVKNVAFEVEEISRLGSVVAKIEPETAAKILTRDSTDRFIRTPLDGLKGSLNKEEFGAVEKLYTKIDDLGEQAVKLGLLGEGKYRDNIGEYIKSIYLKYEKDLSLFGAKKGFKPFGVKQIKGRVEELTPEMMKELGQIDIPAYILFRTAFDLAKDVRNAELFKDVTTKFATDVAQEGFTQMPKSAKFVTSAGKQSEILGDVKQINTDIKPLLSELKQTFKADRETLGQISKLENQFDSLSKLQGEELYKFFNEGTDISKTVTTARKLGTIPEKLQPIANSIKKFKSFEELNKAKEGIELEKLFINGDLERNGFKSMEQFFDTVKNPYKASETKDITKFAKDAPEFTIKGDKIIEIKNGKQVSRNMDATEKKLYEARVAKENLPLKSRIIEGVKPKGTKIESKEFDLLKQKISNFNKGYKFAKKEIAKNQNTIIKIIRDNFPASERGRFLTAIKNATNREKTISLIDDVKKSFEAMLAKADDVASGKQLSKIVKLQKEIEGVLSKSSDVKEITKRSINDSFRNLEKNINELRFTKEDLLDELDAAKLGDLAGKYVPDHIHEYLNEIIESSGQTIGKKLVASFKFSKVIMNPATHARNIMSNKLLNWFNLGMNPLDPKVISSDLTALREIAKGGGQWTDLAKPLGYNLDTFASAEMKALLDSPEATAWAKGNSLWSKTKKKLGDIYQAEENQAKLSAFIYNMKKGVDPEEAWKAAESATFNYAQVTPFVRRLRESLFGMPFITFTVKSTPVIAETLVKAPHRISVLGKIKQGIESLSDIEETEREKASEPPWVKEGFYVKLPMKDSEGRSAYFDMTYILPFGDILSGNFFERSVDRDSGLPESYPISLMKKSPFINLVTEIGKNQDFYGNKIWRDSDSSERQLGDIMRHLTKTIAPPAVSDLLPGGYDNKGEQQQRGIIESLTPNEQADQKRTTMEELLRNVGAKIQPIDADIQEGFKEWNTKKALQSLNLENGALNIYSRLYIPKK